TLINTVLRHYPAPQNGTSFGIPLPVDGDGGEHDLANRHASLPAHPLRNPVHAWKLQGAADNIWTGSAIDSRCAGSTFRAQFHYREC
ncbi:hypothetical protein PMAYCL1PPCAC_28020, partial [Pristionchus mayeri]